MDDARAGGLLIRLRIITCGDGPVFRVVEGLRLDWRTLSGLASRQNKAN
jgi:hypothetical protein